MTTTIETSPLVLPKDWGNPGFFRGIPAYDYFKLDAASKSRLAVIGEKSPMHLKYIMDHGEETTEAMALGSATHAAIFEPERFDAEYAVAPDFGNLRTKEAKERRDAWRAEHDGRETVDADDFDAIRGMRDSLKRHDVAARLIRSQGWTEAALVWNDQNTGELCKSRVDRLVKLENFKVEGQREWSGLAVVDLKTTLNAGEKGYRDFIRESLRRFYHVQAAMYLCGVMHTCNHIVHHMKIGKKQFPYRFFYIAVEKTPPYAVCVYEVKKSMLQHGWNCFQRLLGVYAECKRTGEWPGYGAGLVPMEKPDWVQDEEIEE